MSKAKLPKAKAVGDVVSQKLPINILLFMSISQNVLVLVVIQACSQDYLDFLLLTGDQNHNTFCSTLFKKHHTLYKDLFQVISPDIARRWRGGKIHSRAGKEKWELWKIIRFLCGITVTQVRNLYTGNLYFDPNMQKVEILTGTIQMVI